MGGNSSTSTLKTMWPLLSGAWSDGGTYMHSTELSQFTLHDSSLTLFVDRVLKWTTKEPWFHFPPWTSTYSSPEAMKRIRPEEERQGGINAMFLTDSMNGEVWVIVPKEKDIKQRQPRQWLCGTMAVVGHLIQGASETDLPLIYLELVYPCSWTQGAHQYHK